MAASYVHCTFVAELTIVVSQLLANSIATTQFQLGCQHPTFLWLATQSQLHPPDNWSQAHWHGNSCKIVEETVWCKFSVNLVLFLFLVCVQHRSRSSASILNCTLNGRGLGTRPTLPCRLELNCSHNKSMSRFFTCFCVCVHDVVRLRVELLRRCNFFLAFFSHYQVEEANFLSIFCTLWKSSFHVLYWTQTEEQGLGTSLGKTNSNSSMLTLKKNLTCTHDPKTEPSFRKVDSPPTKLHVLFPAHL